MIRDLIYIACLFGLLYIAFKWGQATEIVRQSLDERAERDRSGADSTATRSSRLYVVRSK